MTIAVYSDHRDRPALAHPSDAGDKSGRLSSLRAYADGVGVGRNTRVVDINIVIARHNIEAGVRAKSDV